MKNALSAEEIEAGDVDGLVRNLLETVSEVRETVPAQEPSGWLSAFGQ